MANINEYIERVQNYVACLVNKDYQAAYELTLPDSVLIRDIQSRIEEYGCTIIPLPAKAFDMALFYQISDKQVDIYIPLWSEEEGQSDLTLSLSCFKNDNKIKINDLSVL
jgi:hypothetical protein